MSTPALVRNRQVVSKSRARWSREGGAVVRYSKARVRIALRRRIRAGWVPVIPSGRAQHERITLLGRQHPAAAIARAYLLTGQTRFDRGEIEFFLDCRLDSRPGATALALCGFALMRLVGDKIERLAA